MTKVELEIYDDTVECINKCINIKDSGLEIEIPVGSVLFENILNLKLIKKYLDKNGKTATFITEDAEGQMLINLAEDTEVAEIKPEELIEEIVEKRQNSSFKFPKIKGVIKIPRIHLNFGKVPILFIGLVIVVAGLGFGFLQKTHKAYIRIIVNSQPLTRSITLKVKMDTVTNEEQKILKGTAITASYEGTASLDTTGEKIVGDKADGTITIYNKTDTEKTFKKNTKVIYKDNIIFSFDEAVEVPAKTEEGDGATYGKATINVTAINVGKDSNIEEGTDLEFEDYKKSEYSAEAKDDFKGGSSKTVKVVAAADLKTLSENLQKQNLEDVQKALEKNATNNQKYIKGSEKITITKESFSNKEGDEVDKLTLVQEVSATALSYSNIELNNVMDKLTEGLVPEGYTISSKDKEIKVEVLGQSTNSVLTNTEADIQITLKTYVIPKIDEEELKNSLMGKSASEAQKIIGGVRNIKTYEFKLLPAFSLLNKVPSDPTKIDLTIEKD